MRHTMLQIVAMVCAAAIGGAAVVGPASSEQAGIAVSKATYAVDEDTKKEARCVGSVDVTSKLQSGCSGKSTCRIGINNTALGSDPCYGRTKVLEVIYACGVMQQFTARCDEYEHMTFYCPAPGADASKAFNCEYDNKLDVD